MALEGGLDPAIIDAIAERRPPPFKNEEERVVYDFARCLHEKHEIDDELYARSVKLLGERAVVELVGLLGYYTLVSMTLNVFEIGLPEGADPELGA